jgi:hypothetical protein
VKPSGLQELSIHFTPRERRAASSRSRSSKPAFDIEQMFEIDVL